MNANRWIIGNAVILINIIIRSTSTGKYGKYLIIPPTAISVKPKQYDELHLHNVCRQRKTNVSRVKAALEIKDIDVNFKDSLGRTPLHEAAAKGHITNLKVLLTYKAQPGQLVDVAAKNLKGDTPLHEAVYALNLQKCQTLLQFGGTKLIGQPNNEGDTPMSLAKKLDKKIYQYFKDMVKTQELLNLTEDASLNLKPHIIQMMDIACCAILEDFNILKLLQNLCHERDSQIEENNFILVDMKCLFTYNKQVKLFFKLSKILDSLSFNPYIAQATKLWLSKLRV